MKLIYQTYKSKTHRIIPSRFPTICPFDWAESFEEVEELAKLEDLTNNRLGKIYLVSKEDWIFEDGATPIMAAFTHPGVSRFSDGRFGVYYSTDSLVTAIAETKFHREIFLKASNEQPCSIEMREYITGIKEKLVDISGKKYQRYLNADVTSYSQSQSFADQLLAQNEWGLIYPSVRNKDGTCFAIFRPPALTIPKQGCHLVYIWDGQQITQTYTLNKVK